MALSLALRSGACHALSLSPFFLLPSFLSLISPIHIHIHIHKHIHVHTLSPSPKPFSLLLRCFASLPSSIFLRVRSPRAVASNTQTYTHKHTHTNTHTHIHTHTRLCPPPAREWQRGKKERGQRESGFSSVSTLTCHSPSPSPSSAPLLFSSAPAHPLPAAAYALSGAICTSAHPSPHPRPSRPLVSLSIFFSFVRFLLSFSLNLFLPLSLSFSPSPSRSPSPLSPCFLSATAHSEKSQPIFAAAQRNLLPPCAARLSIDLSLPSLSLSLFRRRCSHDGARCTQRAVSHCTTAPSSARAASMLQPGRIALPPPPTQCPHLARCPLALGAHPPPNSVAPAAAHAASQLRAASTARYPSR